MFPQSQNIHSPKMHCICCNITYIWFFYFQNRLALLIISYVWNWQCYYYICIICEYFLRRGAACDYKYVQPAWSIVLMEVLMKCLVRMCECFTVMSYLDPSKLEKWKCGSAEVKEIILHTQTVKAHMALGKIPGSALALHMLALRRGTSRCKICLQYGAASIAVSLIK